MSSQNMSEFKKLSPIEAKEKQRSRAEETNPCLKEHNLSLKCLDTNFYDRDSCTDYFENYKLCKRFWHFVYKDRRRKGIQPYLPIPADRPTIKEQYMPYFKGI